MAQLTLPELERHLWRAADLLRGSIDSGDFKHFIFGLLFYKRLCDVWEEEYEERLAEYEDEALAADPEEHRFDIPEGCFWQDVRKVSVDIGTILNTSFRAIEDANPRLKGVFQDVDFANKERFPDHLLDSLLQHFETHRMRKADVDSTVLGDAYEYLIAKFADDAGKKGGEFYTPVSVVRLLVEMIEPYQGRVYDPCCGSSGMFVQSMKFIEAHATGNGNGGKARGDISIFGQESNYTTWRLAKMNLAIRGIDAGQIEHGDTFHNDRHPDLKADYILANPPFNVSDWRGELLREDKRWQYGAPPAGNANFAWVQHIIHHLAPNGLAGFVLSNGSMSSNTSGEGEIRKNMVEAGLVDCMVALPGQLFYSTQIPACLWFLARDKKNGKFRDRRGELLFIDARKLGQLVDRTHREMTEDDITRIAGTYHAWRGEQNAGDYEDVPGFCKSASLEEIQKHGHVLTPGRYVGAAPEEDDGEPFEEKMKRLTGELREQMAEGRKLDEAIEANMKELGYGG